MCPGPVLYLIRHKNILLPTLSRACFSVKILSLNPWFMVVWENILTSTKMLNETLPWEGCCRRPDAAVPVPFPSHTLTAWCQEILAERGSLVLRTRTKPESWNGFNLVVKLIYIFLLSHLVPESIQVTSASKHWTFPFSFWHPHVKDTIELSREIWETEAREIKGASEAVVVTAQPASVHLSPPYWEFFSPSHKRAVSVTATCVGATDGPCWLGELCVPDLGGVRKPTDRQDVCIIHASPTQVLCITTVTQPLKI